MNAGIPAKKIKDERSYKKYEGLSYKKNLIRKYLIESLRKSGFDVRRMQAGSSAYVVSKRSKSFILSFADMPKEEEWMKSDKREKVIICKDCENNIIMSSKCGNASLFCLGDKTNTRTNLESERIIKKILFDRFARFERI